MSTNAPLPSSERVRASIEEFAEKFVGQHYSEFDSDKIINDAVWGTHKFNPFELSLISLPIVQRLRQIRQMGFVNYVYPSAIHTRFEHSLGTAIIAQKLFDYSCKKGESFLSEKDLHHIRAAAILHDIGHGIFSHCSEELYGNSLRGMIDEEFEDKNADPKPHEFIAYLLIKSKPFRDFFGFLSSRYRMEINPQTVANYIVGLPDAEDQRFKVSFINGSFDADKLDYIYRDSRFSGIPLLLDLDRLMHEIAISDLSSFGGSNNGDTIKDLTIGISGVSSVEQIVFNKMLLFSTIYHHQKVKACDCMFQGIFEYLAENKISIKIRDKELTFDNPIDFLWITDTDLVAEGARTVDEELHRLIHNILYRRLLKRAVVISRKTIEGDPGPLLSTNFNRAESRIYLRNLSRKIWKDAGEPCSIHDVWIDIPSPPSFKEANSTYVRTNRTDPDQDLKQLSDMFPSHQWTEQYNQHKLKGHVFCPEGSIDRIAASARKVFEQEGIVLKEEAFKACKNKVPR